MPLILPGNVASATAPVGAYTVANSCRFNDDDEPTLSRDIGTVTLATKSTFSCWVKQSRVSNVIVDGASANPIFGAYTDTDNRTHLGFNDSTPPHLEVWSKKGGSTLAHLKTTASYRDLSAWMHVCVAVDTTQGTEANRIKIYVNGTQVTSFGTENYPDADSVLEWSTNSASSKIGAKHGAEGPSAWTDGYIAEAYFIDGTAYAASDFGEFDEDSPTIWKPKRVSGLTFGDEGFYCDFEDSDNLGDDESGNGNDLTENNIDATDQATDTPTNNFCTLNHLDNYLNGATFSEGNCKVVTGSSPHGVINGTFGLSSGKWYFEMKIASAASGNWNYIGISDLPPLAASDWLGLQANAWGYGGGDGEVKNNSGNILASGVTFTTNDIIGCYIDLDNLEIYWAKNDALINSGTGLSLTAVASTTNGHYFPSCGDYSGSSTGTHELNFGGCPAFTVSSGNADANGYGNFEYDPSRGGASDFDSSAKDFLAICTKNLAEYG